MAYNTLIPAQSLYEHLHEPDWVIVDSRFDLLNPAWGYEDYCRGHIPGAVYAHLDDDLSGPKTDRSGRHPLPEPAEFLQTLERLGISNQSQVVVYDTTSGSFAARLWWMLKYFRHDSVAVLDGGYSAWLENGYPITSGTETRPAGKFSGSPDESMLVDIQELLRLYQRDDIRLIDARSPERFRGEVEPIDTIAGRIPNSINRFHQDNLDPSGRMKDNASLKREFADLLKGLPPRQAVVYCGSGVTSCHHLLAMEVAGFKGARLYAGSWSEWIRDPQRPISRG